MPRGLTRFIPNQEKLEDIISRYFDSVSLRELGLENGVSADCIRNLLIRNYVPLKSRTRARTKYRVNNEFFDEINTSEKAYFFGLLLADGNMHQIKPLIKLALQTSEVPILTRLNNLVNEDRPLTVRKVSEKNPKHQDSYILTFQSERMAEALKKLGMVPNKTLQVKWPDGLSSELYVDFIRGYWEGDGYISRTSCSVTGTTVFCLGLEKYLKETLDVDCLIYQVGKVTSTLFIRFVDNTLKFLNWLYGESTVYMGRKYNKYLDAINWSLKPTWNTLFNEDGTRFTKEQKDKRFLEKQRQRRAENKKKNK